jgi:CheY-like chemotaxis protein
LGTKQHLPEILLVSRDHRLISTMQAACSKSAIELTLCSEARNAIALLKGRKFYAVIVDDIDRMTTAEFLAAVRRSPSTKMAMSMVFTEGPPTAVSNAALVVAKPISMELALRTLRAAQAPISNELRRYVRRSLQIPVTVTLASKRDIQAVLLNISDGGLAIQFADQDQIATNTVVTARFVLPSSADWIQVNGQVVWCDAQGRTGLRCSGLTQNDRERLRKWLETHVENER